jgi:soluble lytic murein transglycosylase-like protein
MTQQKNAPQRPRRLPERVEQLLDAASARYGIAPELPRAVAWTESRGDQSRRGTSGEWGVMQLMPATAAMLKVDPADLAQNIDGGVRYLAQMVRQFGDPGGVAAYNAGPRYGKAAPQNWPTSTRQYVTLVHARAELERAILSKAPRASSQPPSASSSESKGGRTAAVPFDPGELTPVRVSRSASQPPSAAQPSTGKPSDDT